MRGFRDPERMQVFLSSFGPIRQHSALKRHLQRTLPQVRAWSYLSAYEGHAGRAWIELGQALDHVATSRDIEDQIIAAARDAFAKGGEDAAESLAGAKAFLEGK